MGTTDGNVYDRVTSCPRGQNPGTSPSTTTSHHARMESRHHAWASTSRVRSWSPRRPPASPAPRCPEIVDGRILLSAFGRVAVGCAEPTSRSDEYDPSL